MRQVNTTLHQKKSLPPYTALTTHKPSGISYYASMASYITLPLGPEAQLSRRLTYVVVDDSSVCVRLVLGIDCHPQQSSQLAM